MARAPVTVLRVPANFTARVLPKDGRIAASMERELTPLLKAEMERFLKAVVENCIADTAIKSRSGNMFNELRSGTKVTGSGKITSIVGGVYASPYVVANEYGAYITPKNAAALALPLRAALRPDGTPKRKGPNSWRSLGTFIYKSPKTGQAYIAYSKKNHEAGDLVLLYVLVDHVRLKPKLGLNRTLLKYLPEFLAAWGGMIAQAYGDFDLWGEIEAAVAKTRFGRR